MTINALEFSHISDSMILKNYQCISSTCVASNKLNSSELSVSSCKKQKLQSVSLMKHNANLPSFTTSMYPERT